MIRFILFVLLALFVAWCGTTVRLGERTFFGHIKAVWSTPEAQDMKRGVQEGTKPALEKVKRGVEAGYREATRDAPLEVDPSRREPSDTRDIEVTPDAGTPDAGAAKRKRAKAEREP